MNYKELEKIFQTAAKNLHCPHCGGRYSFEKIHIVSLYKSSCSLKLECQNHLPIMATVTTSGNLADLPDAALTIDDLIDGNRLVSKINKISELFKK